jgi:hypothetical protein
MRHLIVILLRQLVDWDHGTEGRDCVGADTESKYVLSV